LFVLAFSASQVSVSTADDPGIALAWPVIEEPMTTPYRPQEPSTPDTVVVLAPDLLSSYEISFDDLAAVTGGSDDTRLAAHELTHVVQQRGR
jgi:hypothetical protein